MLREERREKREQGGERRKEGKGEEENGSWYSLVPKSSYHPVIDCLQFAKQGGEGLVHFIT